MMALNGDMSSTTKNYTFKIIDLTWMGSTMSLREVVKDLLNPDSIRSGFSKADGGNPIYLNTTICNRSAKMPG